MDGGTMRLILTQNLSMKKVYAKVIPVWRARNEDKSLYSDLSVKLLGAAL
jgi:hypothetical protein